MKILIVLPNWLGDAVMATAAIEILCDAYPRAELTLVGSYASIEALKHHPQCTRHYLDETKKSGSRLINTYKFAKKLGRHDLAITLRNQIHSTLLVYLTGTVVTAARRSWHSMITLQSTPKIPKKIHMVEQYTMLINTVTDQPKKEAGKLKLYIEPKQFDRPSLGINPGAAYGGAKRWYPERFAAVAAEFSDQYQTIIFGAPNEVDTAEIIEDELKKLNVTNYINLAGKTSVEELCAAIGGVDMFISNDSGPMHIAAAYSTPTVGIFGPTPTYLAPPWKNERSTIISHDLECAPCQKRECPLKHHDCMKGIEVQEVVDVVKKLI